jgi:hypothetical protein
LDFDANQRLQTWLSLKTRGYKVRVAINNEKNVHNIGALGKVEDFSSAQEASAKAMFKLRNTYQALQEFIY